jgi:hypothetical protein
VAVELVDPVPDAGKQLTVDIVEAGQLADRLLTPQGGVGVLDPAGEHLQVADPALDVAGG